ncbi:MAG: isoprenylcysteine carboxylmethyltransferase family protein [Xanthomonadales bacterium]|nr:isoprenylcysteine carboxylmethyltransferase family protein [Xanthomonadales bacterium]
MGRDRTTVIGSRTGLMGLFDRIRYKELYRQAFGLLLIAVCAAFAEAGHERVIWGFALAAFGQLFRIFAAGTIFKNKRLASTGAYALVRHPLYFGNLLILAGFCIASANLWVIAVVVAFFVIWYPAAIRYEDAKLERLFGEDWRAWSQGTWAIVPNRFNLSKITDTQWSAHQSMIRNGELWITIYLVACAVWLWFRAHG